MSSISAILIDWCLWSTEQYFSYIHWFLFNITWAAISAVVMTITNQGLIAAFCLKSKKSTGFTTVPRFILYHWLAYICTI